jgi:phage anti-repressor protein
MDTYRQMNELNIVELIESNPISTLSDTYQNKLLIKIKDSFTESQQHLFLSSFYCYLNYHPVNDYVISLDDVWKWLGFTVKQSAKTLLTKYFVIEKDYKLLLKQSLEQTGSGGRNKETIMLNINTFKLLCMRAGTKKASEIHDYFLKLEMLLHETIQEECVEMKEKLQIQLDQTQTREESFREKTILEQFADNVQCVYYGLIDDLSDSGEKLIKFGSSNFLQDRVRSHKRNYKNFRLYNAFKVVNNTQTENAMKYHPILGKLRRVIKINSTRHNGLLALNGMSFDDLDIIIKRIIQEIEYSPENYTRLLRENEELKKRIHVLNKKLEEENRGQEIEISRNSDQQPTNNIITFKRVRSVTKSKDGKYHIEGNVYDKLFGTREEVWNNVAYQTSGCLKKSDFVISKSQNSRGKIVSKRKHNMEDGSRLKPPASEAST